MSRALLDRTLLAHAAACGAEVLQPWQAVEPLLEDGRVRGFRLRRVCGERWREVRAALVVAADGRRSLLGRRLHARLGDPSRSGPRSRFGFKVHLDASRRLVEPRIELHLFDGGYAGLGPIEGGRLNLGLWST